MDEIKLNGTSKDIISDNISKLKEIFPDIFEEGKVDFDKLKANLGEYIDDSHEKYNFTWPGKIKSNREAQKQSTGTLRPCIDESEHWDKTQNIYIEGDNLEVLKLLQKAYYNRIKCIYIDPPYNTGKDFIYTDNYQDNLENYLKLSGQVQDDDGTHSSIRLTTNLETAGRFHTNWLNMMYPRLKLARNLLTDDGVIFISIDDNEFENLKRICDEIFGEFNYLGDILWNSTKSVTNTALISVSHTYNLVYFKNKEYYVKHREKFRLPDDGEGFSNPDNDPRGPWKADPFQVGGWRPNQQYEITNPNTGKVYNPNPDCSWKNDYDKFQELIKDNRIVFGKNGEGGPQRKRFLFEAKDRGKVTKTWWDDVETTTNGTMHLKKLFDNKILFNNPKPVGLVYKMLQLCTSDEDIVLDFFSGSGTTAESIIKLNSEDNFNRKFIMVQIPEATDEGSQAYKEGYETICEIGKERIRRSGDKILNESSNKDLDIGFKVFKLDSSNLEKWNPIFNNIQQSLIVDEIKEDRTNEDLVYEIMLKYGIDLTYPIEQHNNIYSIGFGALVICLDDNITKDITNEILNFTKNSSTSRVVFKDSGFASDADKTNIKEILKTNNIDEFITI